MTGPPPQKPLPSDDGGQESEERHSLVGGNGAPPLRPISAETVRVAAARRDPTSESTARFGPVVSKKLHGVFSRTRGFDAPLVQAVIDHTQVDVHAGYETIDEFGEIAWAYAGRPWLTRVSDSFSNCTLGMALSFRTPSLEEVMAAIKHAILPKSYTQAWVESGDLEQVWEAMGIPQEIYADNALEFTGTVYAIALSSVGISLATSPPNTPTSKGRIERGFGTFNQYIHRLSGTTFGTSNMRHLSYDGKTYACHDIAWIWKMLHIFIEDIELKWSKGIQDQPRRRWREGVRRFPVVLPLDLEQFEADMSIHKSRTIQRGGIEYQGLLYSGRPLEELKLRNPDVQSFSIRIDPEDLNFIRVIDPQTMRPIRIACTTARDGPYPLREHMLVRRGLRQDASDIARANSAASARRSGHLQATDQSALEQRARAVGDAQAAVRSVSRRSSTPGLQPPPDASEAARLRALQMLNSSRIAPESPDDAADSDVDDGDHA